MYLSMVWKKILKTYGERGGEKMGKTLKLGNKKVIGVLMILAIIVVSIIGYICINSDVITYAFIEQTQEQIETFAKRNLENLNRLCEVK